MGVRVSSVERDHVRYKSKLSDLEKSDDQEPYCIVDIICIMRNRPGGGIDPEPAPRLV